MKRTIDATDTWRVVAIVIIDAERRMSHLQSVILSLLLRRTRLRMKDQHTVRGLWQSREVQSADSLEYSNRRPTQREIRAEIGQLMAMFPGLIRQGEARHAAKYFILLED